MQTNALKRSETAQSEKFMLYVRNLTLIMMEGGKYDLFFLLVIKNSPEINLSDTFLNFYFLFFYFGKNSPWWGGQIWRNYSIIHSCT